MTLEILSEIPAVQIWPSTEIMTPQYENENYKPWNIQPLVNFQDKTWKEVSEHLISWAILAPSAHNKQPWVIGIEEEKKQIQVYPDPKEIGITSDKKGRQTHVGVGCFATNLTLAMGSYGIPINYEFVRAKGNKDQTSLNFDFSEIQQGNLIHPEVLNIIRTRRAYRGPFIEGYELSGSLLQYMGEIADKEGVTLRVIEDQKRKNLLGKAQALADMTVLKIPAFRNELAHHLVTNDSAGTKVMPGNTFGLNDEEARQVHEALVSSGQIPGHFAAGFPRSDQEGVIKSSAAIAILIDEEEPKLLIKSGMALEKIWLLVQSKGLGVRIMAGMIESPLHNIGLKTILGEKSKYPAVFACIGLPERETWPKSPREQIKF